MKEVVCQQCSRTYYGMRKGKCPSCILKVKRAKDKAEKERKDKKRWQSFKKGFKAVHKHLNPTVKPLKKPKQMHDITEKRSVKKKKR
jgi:threonine synthase